MKDNQVRQQARPKRNNYYANDNKKSYNKNNYQARGRRPMPRRKPSSVKIIPLGGLGQIGMNITAFECNNQILIVDCGLAFPDEDMLGIDLVIPDITYLKDNASKIRGLVITHGHEDHIGAIPYFEKELNVPIYATKLTMALIENKLKEHGILNNVERHVVTHGDKVKLGIFNVEFIKTNHSIADAAALAITTPAGVIVHTGDFKIDHTPLFGEAIDLARFAELGSKGVLALMADSTNVERQGYTPSEKNVGKRLDNLFAEHLKGRMIIATFASNVDRVQHIINSAHKYGRKVAVEGRSMVNIIATASELGYIKIPKNTLIETDQIKNYPDDQIVLITTGSQGETMAALSRMANSTHRKVSIVPSDTIIFSSSPIPGNEKNISKIMNELALKGAQIVFEDTHVSGHACREELRLIYALTKPKYAIPVHGEYRHLMRHRELAIEMGIPKENAFVLAEGDVLTVDDIKKAVRTLKMNKAKPINGSYVAIIDPEVAYDLMKDKEWIDVKTYSDPKGIYTGEIGKLYGVRFVETTEAVTFKESSNTVHSTLVLGADAYGITSIDGGGLTNIVKQLGSAGSADPLNQRSTSGWKAIHVAKILVEEYMVRIESLASA